MIKKHAPFSRFFLGLGLSACFLAPCQTACSPAQQDTPVPAIEDRFAQIDTNNDGKIVLEEFRSNFPNMDEQAFVVIDRNKDNGISRVEWAEFMENHGKSPQRPPSTENMNNIPGDPLIPPVDSSDLPLVRPPV